MNSVNKFVPALVTDGHTPEDVARAMIAGGQKEPFYIFDMDAVLKNIQRFQRLMPRVQIYYAMKANDNEMMLKLVTALGLGFDCASPGEICKVLQLNVNPLNIIYAIPSKTPYQMKYARDSGVRHTTFDSLSELLRIKEHWPDARLLIRFRVEGNSAYQLGLKFGCDFETEAVQLLEEAEKLDLTVIGVAFHVGSACWSAKSFGKGLENARKLFDHAVRAGRQMKIIDIGGGFIESDDDIFKNVSEEINKSLEKFFPDQEVQVIAEPGRYLCESSTALYNSIFNVRQIQQTNENINMIYLNDGYYGTLRFNEKWHTVDKLHLSTGEESDKLVKTILWGPSCDSYDQVKREESVFLPQCSCDDWLVFRKQGAYTFGLATNFSCIEIPLIQPVISKQLWKQIKDSDVFISSDFALNQPVGTPLPSTLAPVILKKNFRQQKVAELEM